jgi:hypothetical protein
MTPRRHRGVSLLALVAAGALAAVVVALTGTVMAILGGEIACMGGGGTALAAPATRAAVREIPPGRLAIYQAAGRRIDIDWSFLAAIGTQECGSGNCAGVNSSGCAGPMQIAYVRESACSPGSGPTIWELYRVDGDGDGVTDINNPADAVFTAARILRKVLGAPPAGGSYAAYREAACGYYGACADGVANYADEVMARAVSYGFGGKGSPPPSDPSGAELVAASGGGCGGAVESGAGPMGPVQKAFTPRRLATLPPDVSVAPGMQCDARVLPNVVYLARRFGLLVTSCYAPTGHEETGEHPLGAAIDAGPRDGDWDRTRRAAEALGWKASCGASGMAPTCARPPIRWIGYNGYSHHGDPQHCEPCAGGPHLHVSWMTSASEGQPENRPRYSYEPASWIEVFEVTGGAPHRAAGPREGASSKPGVGAGG